MILHIILKESNNRVSWCWNWCKIKSFWKLWIMLFWAIPIIVYKKKTDHLQPIFKALFVEVLGVIFFSFPKKNWIKILLQKSWTTLRLVPDWNKSWLQSVRAFWSRRYPFPLSGPARWNVAQGAVAMPNVTRNQWSAYVPWERAARNARKVGWGFFEGGSCGVWLFITVQCSFIYLS